MEIEPVKTRVVPMMELHGLLFADINRGRADRKKLQSQKPLLNGKANKPQPKI